jgi:DNA-binding CsgD family transcriptional regulator
MQPDPQPAETRGEPVLPQRFENARNFASLPVVVPDMSVVSPERARDEIVGLAHRGVGVRDFSIAAARALRRAVPFDGVCVLTVDPATLLPTGEVVENGLSPAAVARLTEIEIREPDYNKFVALLRSGRPAASLSEATGGRLEQSRRQRELRGPGGFEDELRAVLVSGSETWGALTLLRERGRRHFTAAEVRGVALVAGPLAEGLRRGLLVGELSTGGGSDVGFEVGLILLADDGSIERANAAAHTLCEELGPDGASRDHVPLAVRAVASRAVASRACTAGGEPGIGPIARARVRTRSGRWLVAHGSLVGEGAAARVAVVVEPARPAELAPLIVAAYGLSERERKVTELVAQGLPTRDIAARLHLSAFTVQDHLKAIFGKTGTGTRGELVARLFFDHHGAITQESGMEAGGPPPQP